MYIQLLLTLFCFTSHLLYAYEQQDIAPCPCLNKEQQLLLKKDHLKERIDHFFAKTENLKNAPEFSTLPQNFTIITLVKIAQDFTSALQSMTPTEYAAFYSALEDYVKQQADDTADSTQLFKYAIEFLQKTLLINYSAHDLFTFGILYEFFEDYMYINQEMFIVNSLSNN
jgi:hypothetical protein